MIDLVLIDKRWKTAVRNCRTYQGADISSDHSLVMCKLQLRLMCRKLKHNQNALKVDIEALSKKDIRDKFRQCLEEKLAGAVMQDKVTVKFSHPRSGRGGPSRGVKNKKAVDLARNYSPSGQETTSEAKKT